VLIIPLLLVGEVEDEAFAAVGHCV
jgi:hypothetical protein